MYPKYIGQRIKSARMNSGLSQDELAKKLDVHRPTISQIESGKRAVDTVELVALSRILEQPLSFFVELNPDTQTAEDELNILYRADDISESDKPVIDDFIRLCKDYAEIEKFSGIEKDTPFPLWKKSVRTKPQAIQDGEKAAISLRKLLDLGTSPVKDLSSILENYGIKVFFRSLQSSKAWGFSVSSKELGHCIFVNTACVRSRQLFTLAHELGHLYMDQKHTVTMFSEHDSPNSTRQYGNTNLLEVRANAFAAAFLIPEDEIGELLDNVHYTDKKYITPHIIRYLCSYFGVSYPAMVYRLHNLDYFGKGKCEELLKNPIRVSSDHSELQPASLPERYITLALEAYRSMKISIGKLADYLRTDLYNARRLVKDLGIRQAE